MLYWQVGDNLELLYWIAMGGLRQVKVRSFNSVSIRDTALSIDQWSLLGVVRMEYISLRRNPVEFYSSSHIVQHQISLLFPILDFRFSDFFISLQSIHFIYSVSFRKAIVL